MFVPQVSELIVYQVAVKLFGNQLIITLKSLLGSEELGIIFILILNISEFQLTVISSQKDTFSSLFIESELLIKSA
jgi:hypothetical protein